MRDNSLCGGRRCGTSVEEGEEGTRVELCGLFGSIATKGAPLRVGGGAEGVLAEVRPAGPEGPAELELPEGFIFTALAGTESPDVLDVLSFKTELSDGELIYF